MSVSTPTSSTGHVPPNGAADLDPLDAGEHTNLIESGSNGLANNSAWNS